MSSLISVMIQLKLTFSASFSKNFYILVCSSMETVTHLLMTNFVHLTLSK